MFVYLYYVLYKIFKNFINATVKYHYLFIEKNGLSPLLKHTDVPPLTNCLNYKIPHL